VARSHHRLGLLPLNQATNLASSRLRDAAGDQRPPADRLQRMLLLARAVTVLLSDSLVVLADGIHSTTDGVSSLVAPTDLATAHRISDQVVQRLDAHYGPLRCMVHLEPHDPASAMRIPRAGDG